MGRKKKDPADKNLTTRQLQAVELYMTGLKQKEIAVQMGVTAQCVSQWLRSKTVSAYIREVTNKKLASARWTATNKLVELLDDENPWVRLQAIRIILDQNNQMDRIEDTTLVVKFAGMDAPSLPESSEVPADGSVE